MKSHARFFHTAFCIFTLALLSTGFAQESNLADVSDELAQDPNNPILLMQQQMLYRKLGASGSRNMGSRWGRRETNLRRELTGEIRSFGRGGTFASSAALLTGQRAIDESLQLGSIGVNRAGDDPSDFVSIEDIELVEIPSHPWGEMIAGHNIAVPEIAGLIPDDLFFVHMIQPEKFLELEDILQQQSDLFGDVYNLGNATRMKGEMTRRLGIPDASALIAAVDEMAFVSDDLAFKPRTDYALVLKLVNTLAEKGLALIVGDQAVHRKVGDYLVIATHESMIDRIERAQQGAGGAMSNALDYHYALLKMEPRRDGLIYLSEAFIRKLTGPAYRINSRRRNTILNALETLQYSVFAYRRFTGQWPSSLQEMIDSNHIAANAIYAPGDYSIDEDGRVSHRTWGSLWQITPVGQVPLRQISAAEKTNYDRFAVGYKNFFREFFDPIGVAYTISDQLYMHTLILPLIENSDYRDLQTFFSGEPGVLSFLFDPDRLGAVNVAARFSLDDLLVRHWAPRLRSEDIDETAEALRERSIHAAENELSEELFGVTLTPGERLLDFIGDEVFFGVGEENSFSMSNIADIDLWFGLKLNNRDRAEVFFRRLWLRVAEEFGGRNFGIFQLSATEPLSNEYNGQTFYVLPTGFVNIFYIFFDDAFYLTVSQVSMNRLIDAHNDSRTEQLSGNLKRGLAHVGKAHNIAAAMDLEQVASFDIDEKMNYWGQLVARQFETQRNTLREAITLAKLLPNYDGTLANVDGYYNNLPADFYGARFEVDDGTLYLATDQRRTAAGELAGYAKRRELNELLQTSLSTEQLRTRLRSFRAATLGLSFVPEGLEVKLSIGNPNVSNADPRFSFANADAEPGATTSRARIITIAAIVLFVLSGLMLVARRRRASG